MWLSTYIYSNVEEILSEKKRFLIGAVFLFSGCDKKQANRINLLSVFIHTIQHQDADWC